MNKLEMKDDRMVAQGEAPRLVPVKQAAAILNVSTHALYREIRAGHIPAYRFGRKVLIDIDQVLRTLAVNIQTEAK